MISSFFKKIRVVAKDHVLRKRILFILGALIVFRLLAAVPIPGVDANQLEIFISQNAFLGFLNVFSGSGLSTLSIVMLGVAPYITASIIMQLLTLMSPKLKTLYHEEGESGRLRFSQYSRILTVPLAIIQGVGYLLLLNQKNVLPSFSNFDLIVAVIVVTAGSILLMWIGEMISEFGIGNGVSLIIFAGIVSRIPQSISQILFDLKASDIPSYIAFIVVGFIIILGVVFITESERPIPVTYAKQVRGGTVYGGQSTYIPLRLNQAGVMPIIFAISILWLPQMLFAYLSKLPQEFLANFSNSALVFLSNPWVHGFIYFLLVLLFTFFYVAVTFDPDNMSKNLQKSGAFIPGVRPGESTSNYIGGILTRITLVGGIFLGFIAVLPTIVQGATGIASLTIGGTSLLIAVSVVIDLLKKIDAQMTLREY
jgi:preprotein translocase subunit SecY